MSSHLGELLLPALKCFMKRYKQRGYVMRIFKFFFDDAKEEQWINDMANQGWHLKKRNGYV